MKKRMTTLCLLLGLLLMISSQPAGATDADSASNPADNPAQPVLLFVDASGSMKEKITVNDKSISGISAAKQLLIELAGTQELNDCQIGIYRMRHIPGSAELYVPFLKMDEFTPDLAIRRLEKDFATEYPLFNRRTPLADAIRQLDKQELDSLKGNIKIVIISDGNESFYDIRKDEKNNSQNTDPDDPVTDPLMEIRRLAEKYGEKLLVHTVFIGVESDGEKPRPGKDLLSSMADIGNGKAFQGKDLLENEAQMSEFSKILCSRPEPVQKQPVTIVQPAEKDSDKDGVFDSSDQCPETPAGVKVDKNGCPADKDEDEVYNDGDHDSDGDGVIDTIDKCPESPVGVTVNSLGCWVLAGVTFDTGKHNIKPQFYPAMNEVLRALNQNADLHVEIQGHTDNVGSPADNMELSNRRAKAVMNYLIENGIGPERLTSVGYGLTMPATSNANAQGRAINRRVELKPTKQ
ncbi:OmpA family protein [Desulfobacterales bacterium HSG16]|nr:OmpA family protein [Desulfobacterales bacterium HSG16]